jgi:hypothetical protein
MSVIFLAPKPLPHGTHLETKHICTDFHRTFVQIFIFRLAIPGVGCWLVGRYALCELKRLFDVGRLEQNS